MQGRSKGGLAQPLLFGIKVKKWRVGAWVKNVRNVSRGPQKYGDRVILNDEIPNCEAEV
jgi:hypothetical protein